MILFYSGFTYKIKCVTPENLLVGSKETGFMLTYSDFDGKGSDTPKRRFKDHRKKLRRDKK